MSRYSRHTKLKSKKSAKNKNYDWLDKMVGVITIGDKKKTVNISENVDKIYYR